MKYMHKFSVEKYKASRDIAKESILTESADNTKLIFSFGRKKASFTFDFVTKQFKKTIQNVLLTFLVLQS